MRMRTLNEAAAELGTTRERLRRGIAAGRYPAMKWRNRFLVDIDVLAPILAAEDEAANTIGIKECAEQLGLSVDVIRRMARSGVIPSERRGRYFRFRLHEVQAAIEQRMKDGGAHDTE